MLEINNNVFDNNSDSINFTVKAFSYPFYSEIKIFPSVFFIYDKRLNDLLIILPIAERKKNKLVTNWTGYNVVKTKWLTQFFENLE